MHLSPNPHGSVIKATLSLTLLVLLIGLVPQVYAGFPQNWGRKCELIIQSSQITGDLTEFPVLIIEAKLPQEMFDSDGTYPALNGGGAYGSEAVWSNCYEAVLHLQESGSGNDDEFEDASGNAHHGTGGGLEGSGDPNATPAQTNGKFGYAQNFDDATSPQNHIHLDSVGDAIWTAVTVQAEVTLSVSVDNSTFTFGTNLLNTWLTPQSSVLTNNGDVAEDFTGQISQFTDGSNNWTINSSANGADQIRAQWSITSSTGPWTDISAYDTDFTIATNVAVSNNVTLWFRIETPTSTLSYNEYSSTLTVTAQEY